MNNYRIAIVITVSSCFLVGGCVSPHVAAARKLGTAGIAASGRLSEASTGVETGFSRSLQRDTFLRALQSNTPVTRPGQEPVCFIDPSGRPEPYVTPTFPPQAAVDRVSSALAARTALAEGLGATYSAWLALAEYDSAGEVEAGVENVFDAVNGLRATTELSPLPKAAGAIAAAGAGSWASHRQGQMLLESSRQVRRALAGYLEALDQSGAPTQSVMQDTLGQSHALTVALWRRGYLDANDLIADLGADSGLSVPEATDARLTATDPALCAAVRGYLGARQARAVAAVGQEYAALRAAIVELDRLHLRFENDVAFDTGHLVALLDRLTTLAKTLAPEEDNAE